MADREKVFDALRNCVTEPKCKDCPWEDCEKIGCKRVPVPVTLLLDVLKLLKEQEPVEPIKAQINQNRPLYFRCYCRRCGNPVGNMIGHSVTKIHSNFCDRCGQAVKWE